MNQTATILEGHIHLPMPPGLEQFQEMDIYSRFMRHLRHVPNSRTEIKVLSAIQFTSDMLDCSDAHISKVLVDLGLRAPRMAFPADFLSFVHASLMRSGWEVGGPSPSLIELKAFWDRIGEDKFDGFWRDFPLLSEDAFA
jgi:hypothetical protein